MGILGTRGREGGHLEREEGNGDTLNERKGRGHFEREEGNGYTLNERKRMGTL